MFSRLFKSLTNHSDIRSREKHFSMIADTYQELRTTDREPIEYIIDHLPSLKNLEIIDLGCGTGRYDLLLLDELDVSCNLTGVDANADMLNNFIENLKSQTDFEIKSICAPIEELGTGEIEKYDLVLSFNALHHFNLSNLMTKIDEILKPNGFAFLYSRTQTQNQRSIWGKYFPKFNDYENRLKSLTEMEEAIYDTEGIELKEIKIFKYYRFNRLFRLVEQARNFHYSTFSIYDSDELEDAIESFEKTIENEFTGIDNLEWIDRNVMLQIQKL